MRLAPLPAFQDDYLRFLHDGQRALAVDPGEAHPAPASLQREGLELQPILVTHHHPDRVARAGMLRGAAAGEGARPFPAEGRPAGGAPSRRDTAFLPQVRPAAGKHGARGRGSQEKFALLPGQARAGGTHEYTLSNLKSASGAEPGNLNLSHYRQRCEELRAGSLPTVHRTLRFERQVNPFLRTREPAVVQAAQGHDAATGPDEMGVFATLRAWKNGFR